ncbi:hypothetical protein GCM10008933_28120 [Paenibacillus motobuensis]|uniref:Uncharacterized protein n=1 Tax=Paenibacillus motobuensis TaxID=295324 RepID=A0ABP3IA76_9BACL
MPVKPISDEPVIVHGDLYQQFARYLSITYIGFMRNYNLYIPNSYLFCFRSYEGVVTYE